MNNDNLRTHLLHLEQAGHLTDDETTTLLHGLNALSEAKPNLTAGPSLAVGLLEVAAEVSARGRRAHTRAHTGVFGLVRAWLVDRESRGREPEGAAS